MAQKLSWTELRRALAARAGVSEKEANTFLNALSAQLTEALKTNKQVKINGLGTFRLQAVAPRKSVNVTTGEEITIEGYNKIAFSPEAGVKELVEKNTGEETSSAPIDPIKKLGEQAEEIVDILADLGQNPKGDKTEKPVKPKKKKAKTPKVETPEVETPEIETPAVETPEIEEPKPVEPDPIEPEQPVEPEQPQPVKPQPKNHFLHDVLICVTALLLLLFGAYFFFRSQLSGWIEQMTTPQPAPVEVITPQPPVMEEPEEPVEVQQAETETPQEITYAGWITEEPMHQDSRLAWMSKRYYGSKVYWPYLYDANRDRLADPNRITTGTPIRVPELTAEQRDTTNAQTRATLERLKKEAQAAMK